MISFILLAIGLLLIMLEFYLPGAVMGILGGLFVLGSILVFASEANSLLAIVIFIVCVAISIGLLIKFTLKRIVSDKSGYSIYSDNDQEGFQASSFDASAIGKTGTVLSDLKPGGYILIDGQQHQAISITGYIPKGEEVIVLSGQEESLIVKSKKRNT
jgi:membrane-bound ClpP family serine protease